MKKLILNDPVHGIREFLDFPAITMEGIRAAIAFAATAAVEDLPWPGVPKVA
ncbi:MAG: hypothetical protein HQL65_19060 [Magnetococcales bacterium]|nr:hypothetical protein [Magnetococcales bacterium]